MKAINLKCLGLVNPLGIDVLHPRITWNIDSFQKQSAFEVIYSINNGIKRTSGRKITSSMNYTFEETFNSRDIVTYVVRVFANNSSIGNDSEQASFEMGLLHSDDFKAKFVGGLYEINKKYRYPVSCFRKKFLLNAFKKARLYISSLGNYDLVINKRKITDNVLMPGYTNYKKRLQYQTYDITEYLKIGFNELEIEVADGYFRGSIGKLGKTYYYGEETGIIFQLEVEDLTNKIEIIYSDETIEFSNDGKYLFADMKDGEIIDATQVPSYDGKSKIINYKTTLCSSNCYPIVRHEKFKPKVFHVGKNLYMLDFEQLITGFLGFSYIGNDGDTFLIKLGASIDQRGILVQDEIQSFNSKKLKVNNFIFKDGYVLNLSENDLRKVSPLQIIKFRCKKGENTYETKFSIFAFKYVLVETNVDLSHVDFYAISVHSKIKQVSTFSSNNALLNKFFDNACLTIKDLSLDFPFSSIFQDRSGDFAKTFMLFKSASFAFDYYPLMNKYLKDIFDSQLPNGTFKTKAPCGDMNKKDIIFNNSYLNSDCPILIPFLMYQQYGDYSFVKGNYDKFVDFGSNLIKRCQHRALFSKNIKISPANQKYLLNNGISFVDETEPKEFLESKKTFFSFPNIYESTLYAHLDFKALALFASILKRPEEALFSEYEIGTKTAFNELLIKNEFNLNTKQQSKIVTPLYFDILNVQYEKFAKDKIVENFKNDDFKITCGNFSAPYFIFALFKADKNLAIKTILSERADKWIYLAKNNSTTLFEVKNSEKIDFHSKLTLIDFIFSKIAGINILKENYFIIKPNFGEGISSINCEYNSVYGLVKVNYKIVDNLFTLNLTVPGNCDANLILPSGKTIALHPGIHTFSERI